MTDARPSADLDRLDALAEEFAGRLRRGERPTVAEYAERYPEEADRIRELFPAVLAIEQAAPLPSALPPVRLGDYRIVREIGRGGMGVVYEAVQESIGRPVALKVLPAAVCGTPRQRDRFRREVRAAGKLHHTNIVPVFGTGEADGALFYAMQYIPGADLDRVLKGVQRVRRGEAAGPESDRRTRTPPLPQSDGTTVEARAAETDAALSAAALASLTAGGYFRRVAELIAQAADAVAHAHAGGVLHRDVKPSNLLLDADGRVWVTDFGLAKAGDQDDLTASGDVLGTPRYMAPERFRGRGDGRSDVYALGATLYELTALRPAVGGSTPVEVMRAVVEGTPAAPRSVDPRIPADLETVIQTAMAKNPDRRYPTAAALAADLRRFLADEPVQARRPSRAERAARWCRQNRPQVVGAAAVFAALAFGVVGTGVGLFRSEAHRRQAEANAEAERAAKDRERQQRERAERAWERVAQVLDAVTNEDNGAAWAAQPEISPEQKRFLTEVASYYDEVGLQTATDRLGREQTALAVFRVGQIQSRIGESAAATSSFRKAHDLYLALAAEFNDDPKYALRAAACRIFLSRILIYTGKRTDGTDLLRQAVKTYRTVQPSEVYDRWGWVQSLCALASVLHESGRSAEAAPLQDEALRLLERFAADHPCEVAYSVLLADLAHDRAVVTRKLGGNPAEVEALFREAANRADALREQHPANPRLRQRAAVFHGVLADSPSRSGPPPHAETELRRAIDLLRPLVVEYPKEPEYRYNLANFETKLGILLRPRDRAEALILFRDALRLYEQLVTEDADRADYQIGKGGAYCNVGRIHLDSGQYAESLPWFHRAVSALAPRPGVPPKDRQINYLMVCHKNRYEAYARLSLFAEALDDWRKYAEYSPVTDRLYRLANVPILQFKAGRHADAVATVRELTGSAEWSRGRSLDLASQLHVYAQLVAESARQSPDRKTEYADLAMELLVKAKAAGYRPDRDQVQRDFAPLRDRPDFVRFVEALPRKREVLPPPRLAH